MKMIQTETFFCLQFVSLLLLLSMRICTDTCSDGYYSRTGVSTLICSACDTSCFTCSGFGTSNCLTCAGRIETPGDTPSGKCITGCAGGQFVGWDSICTDVATLSAEFTALALDPANTTLVFRKAAWLANSIRDASSQTRQQTVIEKVTDATCAIYKAQEGFNVLATVTNIYGSYIELNQASVTALSTHLLTTMTNTEFAAVTSMEYFRILLTVYQNAIVQFAKASENGLTVTAAELDGLLEQKELIKQNMITFMAGNGTDSELSSTEYISLNYYIGANSQLTIAKFESTTTAEEIKFERQTNENFFVYFNTEGATLIIPTVATTVTYLAIDFYDIQPYNALYATPVTATASINESPGLGLKFYQFVSGVLDTTTYGISTAIAFSNTDSDVQNFTIQLPSSNFAQSYLPTCEMREVSANGWVACGTDYHYSIAQVNSGVQISVAKYQVTPISKAFFMSIATQCPQGYFLNAAVQCEQCPSSCLTCSSATQCTRCNYAFEVPASAALCTCTTAGEFADYGTGSCQVATDVSADDFTALATLADLKVKTKQAIDSANGAKQTDAAAQLLSLSTDILDLEIVCNILSLLGTSETLETGAVASMVSTLEAMIALDANIFNNAVMTQDLAELVFAAANSILRQANLLDSTKILSAWQDFQSLIELYIQSQWMIADSTLQTWTTSATTSYSLLPKFIKLYNGDMLGFFFINKNSQIPCDKVAIDFGSVQIWFPLKDFLYLRTYRGAIGAFSFHDTANNPFKGYTTTSPATLDPQVTVVPAVNIQLWGAKETDETPPSTPTWEKINEPFIEAKIFFDHADSDANINYFCNQFDLQDEAVDTDNYWTIGRHVCTDEQSLTGVVCSSHFLTDLFSVRQNDCSSECKTCVGLATSDEKQECTSCVVGKVLVPHSTLTGFYTCKNEAALLASDIFIVGKDVRIRNADANLCLGVTEVDGAAGVKQWVDCEAATYKYNTILWTITANAVDPTKYDLTNKYDVVNAFGSPNALAKVDYLMTNAGDSQHQQLIQRFAQIQNVDGSTCYYYDGTSILLEDTCDPLDVTNTTNPWATATWSKIKWFEFMHSFDFRGNEINYDTPVIQQNSKSEYLDSLLFGFPSVASGIKQDYNIEYIFAKELNIDASISGYPVVTNSEPGYTCSSFNPFSNVLFEMAGTQPAEQITTIISLQDLLDCGFQKVDHSVVGYLIERDHDENAIFYYKLTVTYESAITVEGQIETDAQITEVIIKRGDDLTEQLQVFVPSVYLVELLQGQLEGDVPLLVDLSLGRVFDIKVALPEGIESSFSFALTRLDTATSTFTVAEMSNMFTSFEVPLTLISGQPSSDGNVYYIQVEIPSGASYPDGQYLFETDAALTLLTSRRLLQEQTELQSTAQLAQSFKFSTGETTDQSSDDQSESFKKTLIFILCGVLALLLIGGAIACYVLKRKLTFEEAKIKKAVQLSSQQQQQSQQNDTLGVAGLDTKMENNPYSFPQNQSQSQDDENNNHNKDGLVELDLDDI